MLREFAIKGYVIDKKRMENGSFIGVDYFEHLLAEIREIRLSERRFYQKLTDIVPFSVRGSLQKDSRKEHMGLTTWENAPHGKIVKPDVSIAKNYLNEIELEDMGRLVNAVLDMAERMARRHIPMTMGDWADRIDIILEDGGDAVLGNAGQISVEFAKLNSSLNQSLRNIVLFRTNCSNRISIDSAILFWNFRMISNKSYPVFLSRLKPGRYLLYSV